MEKIKTVGIIPNTLKDSELSYTDRMISKLCSCGIKCLLPTECGVRDGAKTASYEELYRDSDCLIILGGDGTILRHSSGAARYDTAILGVNIGTIGFICELYPDEEDELEKLARGDYDIEKRYMLDVSVIRDGKCIGNFTALNDAVIESEGISKVIAIELYRDDKRIIDYMANGLIVSTPTGSTAYSLAAGGPIVDPETAVTTVTPICPHTLTEKPMIFDMNARLSCKISSMRGSPCLSVDGRDFLSLKEGDVVRVTKSESFTRLIRLKSLEFYDIIYQKLSIKV